jgi:hypothetical protein
MVGRTNRTCPDILRFVRRAIEPDMAAAGACGKPDRPDRQDTPLKGCPVSGSHVRIACPSICPG